MPTTDSIDRGWSKAFASQALSDLEMRNLLADNGAPKCHRLHFLQMAAEKLCKAFLIRENGYDLLRLSHGVIAKTLPLAVRQVLAREHYSEKVLTARLKAVKQIGREIELLSPACAADGVRDDNCEYPWRMVSGDVAIPHQYSFPNIQDDKKEFVQLNKLMRAAAETYLA